MARATNHLAGETSPYLLQHMHNPVDWHAWGDTALARARAEDKPIFLSIGYAACHWCHVMERESFENPAIAALLNRFFVPIKVDREERPDLDEIYMSAVQLLAGQGGWPLSVFLTPTLEPFFGGTYFPPHDRDGRPGFSTLLERIRDAWADRRSDLERSAAELADQVRRIATGGEAGSATRPLGRQEVMRAAAELAGRFDPHWGGFGHAPKFPPDGALALLLREHARTGEPVPREMLTRTLQGMALGGLYDHIGGGFARYSVDERWLVPHFEKMLYNQALLVPLFLDAWLLTREPLYRRVAAQTLDFVRRELTGPHGGFLSSLDADSEGVEGRFYVWTPEEIAAVLSSEDAVLFGEVYGVTAAGNFEGRSIPNLLRGSLAEQAAARGVDERELDGRLEPMRRSLLAARERRVRPATDDKVLAAWNGLMLSAFARGYQVLDRAEDLVAARRAAEFLVTHLVRGTRLWATFRAGRAKLNAYLDDYAFVGRGLVDLYEAVFEPRWLELAATLAATLVTHFEDRERGGFFFTSDDHESLLARSRSVHDGALPSGAGVAAELLLRLAVHRDDERLRSVAERALSAAQPLASRMPSACAALLVAAELAQAPGPEIAIVGPLQDEQTQRLLGVVRARYRFRPAIQVGVAVGQPGLALLAGKVPLGGRPAAYVCRDQACRLPTTDPIELERQLGDDDGSLGPTS